MTSIWQRVTDAEYRRVPWLNGRGQSVDLAVVFDGRGTDWSNVVWRLATTSIPEPGPFSHYAGLDRTLLPIRGEGLSLAVEGGPVLDASRPLVPVRFPGEAVVTSRLAAGIVSVVNLMCRRGTFEGDLAVLEPGRSETVIATTVVLYAFDGPATVRADGEVLSVPAGECLRVDHAGQHTVGVEAGRMVLAWVRPATAAGPLPGSN